MAATIQGWPLVEGGIYVLHFSAYIACGWYSILDRVEEQVSLTMLGCLAHCFQYIARATCSVIAA